MSEAAGRSNAPRLLGGFGLLGFVLLFALSCLLYPIDASGHGYSFWGDYLCDLLDPLTPGGLENPARPWMVASLCALAGGLGGVFDEQAKRAGRRVIQVLGWLAALSSVAVGFFTALELLRWHGVALLVGGPAALAALVLSLGEQKKRGELLPVALGGAALLLGSWNLVQFARQFVLEAPRWDGLPAVQKGVLIFGAAWMAASLRRP